MDNKGRLPELDSLRGIAVILVMMFHFTVGELKISGIFNFGCTGVDLFFIISGFVIFLTIEKIKNYKDFIFSRFSRLYPLYWFAVTVSALVTILWLLKVKLPVTFPTLRDYIVNLTMVQYYLKVKNIDGVYWSLIIELLFYFFILIVYLTKKLNKIEPIILILLACCLIYGTVLKSQMPHVYDYFSTYIPLINFFPLFAAGIVFYKIKFYPHELYRYALIILCLVTQVFLFDYGIKVIFISQFQYALMLLIFFALFVLYSLNLLRFIVNRFTLFTGRISYSLYLTHNIIGGNILLPLFIRSRYFHYNIWLTILIIVTPLVFITATLVNKYIEVPAMAYLKRKRAGNMKLA